MSLQYNLAVPAQQSKDPRQAAAAAVTATTSASASANKRSAFKGCSSFSVGITPTCLDWIGCAVYMNTSTEVYIPWY